MDDSPLVDVFISHHRTDANAVQELATALAEGGLSVRCGAPASDWPDQNTERITALSRAKSFVAWLSPDYCVHAAAQREFMLAFVAASARMQAPERIVIIDALHSQEASLPSVLRDHCQIERPGDAAAIARRIRTRIESLREPLRWPSSANPMLAPLREFTGRIGHLWHLHEALAGGQVNTPRVALLCGDPGVGKSWLADEYARTFEAAYPGGVFRLDAGWLEHASHDEFARVREFAWRQLAIGLQIDTRARSLEQVETRVRQRLDDSSLSYLWIIDHLPAGQDSDAVRAWFAPTTRGSTLFISRSDEYTRLGTVITLGPLDRDSASALLERHKPMVTQQEREAGRQLLEQLGCHATSLHLAAMRLTRSTYDRLLLQLAAPPREAAQLADALAEQLPHPQLVGIALVLHQTISQLATQARQALRLIALLGSAPVPCGLLTTAFAQQLRGSSAHAASHTQIATDELVGFGLAHRTSDDYVRVSPLVRATTLFLDREQDLAATRELMVAILATELPQCPQADDRNPLAMWIPHVLHIARTASPSAQLIEINAWLARFEQLGSLRSGNRRAVTLLERGDLNDAQRLLDMELAARRLGLGEHHPQTVTPVNNLAVALCLRGDFAQAQTLLEQAIDVRRKALGDRHADLLTPLNNLGVVLWHEGDLRKARTVFERVVELRRQLLGDTHPDTLVSMRNLAVVLRSDGEYVAARTLLEHVVEVRGKSLGTQHVDTCTAMASLAETLREQSEAILARISDTLSLDTPLLSHDRAMRTV
jgi:tetratricopeptide (TPR) repeat protein